MSDKNELAKLGLAFAVGVALSAGYVALGLHGSGTDLVVVQERCPDAEQGEAPRETGELTLAPVPGDEPVPEGFTVRVGLDAMWVEQDEAPRLRLEHGRFAAEELAGSSVRALESATALGDEPAVLWLDHRIPGATLEQLIFTLGRAGFEEFALVVAGDDQSPRAYRFAANRYDDFSSAPDTPWTAGLSLRLEDAGTTVWVRPQIDGRPGLGAPDPVPLDLGGEGSKRCVLGQPLPAAERLAELERELCDLDGGGPLGVEFMLARERSVGELLALRALDSRGEACRGPSFIAGPEPEPTRGCAGARSADEALARFAAAERAKPGASAVRSKIEGALEKDAIRGVVVENIADVRHCYNEGLQDDPELTGSVLVEFVIDEQGEVRDATRGAASTLGDAEVEQCIVDAVASWRFPSPEKGKVKVSYPFILSPG